jgi:hydrogenase-1 operon protein HyaE
MTDQPDAASPALHPLLARMISETGGSVLEAAELNDWQDRAGTAMLVFAGEPDRYKETLDLAVVVPELAKARPGAFRVGLLIPTAARALAPRFGFARWPAIVMLRNGHYLGAVDGLRDWSDYIGELDRLLTAEPARPPIRLTAVGAPSSCS